MEKDKYAEVKKAIGKKVNIELELEKFFPDMVGEGKLSLPRFEKLLKRFETACEKCGFEHGKLVGVN